MSDPLADAPLSLLLDTASDIVEKISTETTFFDLERDAVYPRFDSAEVVKGRVLGRGGFCVVSEVKEVNLIPSSSSGTTSTTTNDPAREEGNVDKRDGYTREFVAKRCVWDGDSRYAIKILSDECREDNHRFLKGIIDLAVEAKFLAVLEHPHIIKMRGVARSGPFQDNYFIILDKLDETLEQKLLFWKKKESKNKGVIGAITSGKVKRKKMQLERMHVAHDLACAMRYMHRHNIIYRDLKPDNIGFDVRGDVKIFDLGLAKELRDAESSEEGTFNLTGFTGSMRYMAPEVHKCEPYNLKADVYSFGVLLWQIISLDMPYKKYSKNMYGELIVHMGYRPALDKTWPEEWGNLMKNCWSPDIRVRPGFEDISKDLAEMAAALNCDNRGRPIDNSQRTVGSNTTSR